MENEVKICMVTGDPIVGAAIQVSHQGVLIGHISANAVRGAKTVRLTFTRKSEQDLFGPLQGSVVEMFRSDPIDDEL